MNPLDWLRQAGAYRESDSDRDGFLSYKSETHAVGIGVYHGFTTSPRRLTQTELPDHPDVQAEPHYYKAAFVVGALLQWAILLTLGYGGVSML